MTNAPALVAPSSVPSNGSDKSFSDDAEDVSWENVLNRIDESISRPVFRLGLPKWVEFVFSIPASFFGTTAALVVGPLWIALLAVSQQRQQRDESDETRILCLTIITFFVTALYIIAWGYLQFGEFHGLSLKLFWNHWLFLLAYPWSVGILACTVLGLKGDHSNDDDASILSPNAIFSMAIYPLILFPLVILPITELKKITRRARPARKDLDRGERGEDWTGNKKFPAMTRYLAEHNGFESFPSGDVAVAALVAIPLWSAEGRGGLALALAIVISSGLGRMYVLAHHLLDVVCGALLTLGVHWAATALGCGVRRAEWWHPLLTIGGFVALALRPKMGPESDGKARRGR